jgi:hypothetical protein
MACIAERRQQGSGLAGCGASHRDRPGSGEEEPWRDQREDPGEHG